MNNRDITQLKNLAAAYFDQLEAADGNLSSVDRSELESVIVRAGSALLVPGRSLLVGEEDHKDLRRSMHRMNAALRLKGYQVWDTRVIFDEDVYRGTEPGGQSEYGLDSIDRARSEFMEAFDQFVRIGLLSGASEGGTEEDDDLLPLLRRRQFDRDIHRFSIEGESTQAPWALIMIDIDHFKKVNDGHGHDIGDQALIAVARVIRRCAEGKGRAYRYGGEELAVLAPNSEEGEAWALAERMRSAVQAHTWTERKLCLTISAGVAVAPIHGIEPATLIKAADTAMYEAKHEGRNRVKVTGGGLGGNETRAINLSPSDLVIASEPFKIPKLGHAELDRVVAYYRSLGAEPVLPRSESRDVNLASGYALAYYPGTTREVWVGLNSGIYEHLLMLKPQARDVPPPYLLPSVEQPLIVRAEAVPNGEGGTPGVFIKVTNGEPEPLEQTTFTLTDIRKWDEPTKAWVKTSEIYNNGDFTPVRTGKNTLYTREPNSLCFIRFEGFRLDIAGDDGNAHRIRTAGIWRLSYRIASGGRHIDGNACIVWKGEGSKPEPVECPS